MTNYPFNTSPDLNLARFIFSIFAAAVLSLTLSGCGIGIGGSCAGFESFCKDRDSARIALERIKTGEPLARYSQAERTALNNQIERAVKNYEK